MTKEKDILLEVGDYWVLRDKNCYHVMKNKVTHAVSLATFDQYDLAETYCVYMGNRK